MYRVAPALPSSHLSPIGTALTEAFSGADAVLTALGVTSASFDRSALLSTNMATVEASMLAAGVDRFIVINTLLTSPPGKACEPGHALFLVDARQMGRGATEQQAVVDALGGGAFSSLRWTLFGPESILEGRDERPVASADWEGAQTPGCPSRMKPWAGGCLRRPRPMILSAQHRLYRGAVGEWYAIAKTLVNEDLVHIPAVLHASAFPN